MEQIYTNRKEIMSNKRSKQTVCLLALVIILFWGLRNIGNVQTITIIDDEFGYWGMGAQLAGLDWTSLLRETYFYSYGYGLVVAPLIKLGVSLINVYRTMTVINTLLIVMDFAIAFYVLNKVTNAISVYLKGVIALFVTLTANNVYMIDMGTPEVLLCSAYWLLFLAFFKIVYEERDVWLLGIPVITVFLYSLHNRSLGVVIIVGFFEIYYLIRNIKNKKKVILTIISILLLASLFFAEELFRSYIVDNWYNSALTTSSSGKSATNNYSTTVGRISNLFSLKQIGFLILSVCGKIYSQVLSTYGLCLLPIVYVLVIGFGAIRKKHEITSIDLLVIIITLGFLAEIGITSIFYQGTPRNITAGRIIQGRYTEFAVGPYILLAFVLIIAKKLNKLMCSMITAIATVVIAITAFEIEYAYNDELMGYNNAGLIEWFELFPVNRIGIIVAGIVATIIGLLLILLLLKKVDMAIIGGLTLMIIVTALLSSKNVEGYLIYKNEKISRYLKDVIEYTENTNSMGKIYYLKTDTDNISELEYIKLYQFIYPQKEIEVIYDEKVIDEGIICMSSSEENMEYYRDKMKFILNSERLLVFEK